MKKMRFLVLLLVLMLAFEASPRAQFLLPNAQQTFLDANGDPLAAGKVYTYVPGTTTPKLTFSDPNLSVPNTNPIVLDGAGRAIIWASGLIRQIVQDSSGTQEWDSVTSAGQNFLPISLLAYGAVCDGLTDDSNAFDAAIAASAGKGAIVLPSGVCAISRTVAFTTSSTGLVCPTLGAASTHNIGSPPTTGCWLKWIGGAGGTMVSFIAPSGSLTQGVLVNEALQGVNLDGNSGLAGGALLIESIRNSVFQGVYAQNFNGGYVLDVNVVQGSPTNFGDPCDSQFNTFENISINQFGGTSTAVRLGTWINTLLANQGCNASFNTFRNLDIAMANGNGILLDGGDNNVFEGTTRVFRAGGGIGLTLDLSIHSNVNPGSGTTFYYPTNSNKFAHLSVSPGTPGIVARGKTSFPTCSFTGPLAPPSATPSCTSFNIIDFADIGNAANQVGVATIEPGAVLQMRQSDGRQYFCGLPWVDPECFGAIGDGSHDDLASLQEAVRAIGLLFGNSAFPVGPLHLSNKQYKVSGDLILDFGTMAAGVKTEGFKILSDQAILDGHLLAGTPTLEFRCDNQACLNFSLLGKLTVQGAYNNGAVVVLGKDNLSDLFQNGRIDYLVPQSFSSAPNAVGLKLNAVNAFDIKVQGASLTSGSGSVSGAIQVIQLQNSSLGAYNLNWGNTGIGLQIPATAGTVKHNRFGLFSVAGGNTSGDTCVTIDVATAAYNTFQGGGFGCHTGIGATAGAGNHFVNLDLTGVVVPYGGSTGITVDLGANGTPTIQSSAGLGGGTVAIAAGARDQAGAFTVTYGAGAIANAEQVVVNLPTLFPPNGGYACSASPQDGNITWATALLAGAIRTTPDFANKRLKFDWTVTAGGIANTNTLSVVWNCYVF